MDATGRKPIDDEFPYAFDLIWDIKTRGGLMKSLLHDILDAHSKIKMMKEYNLKFPKNLNRRLVEKLNESIISIEENTEGESDVENN